MKECYTCKEVKPSHQFHKDKSKKDGLVSSCRACKKEYREKYYRENSERLKAYAKEWHNEQMKKRPDEIRRKTRDRAYKYRARNLDDVRKRNAKWMKNEYHIRYKSDESYTANRVIRRVLHNALRNIGTDKEYSTWDLLGYSKEEFKDDIESKMRDGMNWSNFGDWHIDHIKPVSAFIEEGESDPSVINSLSNLQPLWAEENLRKGAKYDT